MLQNCRHDLEGLHSTLQGEDFVVGAVNLFPETHDLVVQSKFCTTVSLWIHFLSYAVQNTQKNIIHSAYVKTISNKIAIHYVIV